MQRIHQRTTYDLEMIREIGFCKGIENYSRHFSEDPLAIRLPAFSITFPKIFFSSSMSPIKHCRRCMLCIMATALVNSRLSNLAFASLPPLTTAR